MHLRFTIRDLLWLAVVVALAVGWWLDRQRSENRLAEITRNAAYLRRAYADRFIHSINLSPNFDNAR